MSYCEFNHGFDDEKSMNLESQFEYATTIGVMLVNNSYVSFASAKDDLDKLESNMEQLGYNEENAEALTKSKSKMFLFQEITEIHKLGVNWVDELTEYPDNDLQQLKKKIDYILSQAQEKFGLIFDVLSERIDSNSVLNYTLNK